MTREIVEGNTSFEDLEDLEHFTDANLMLPEGFDLQELWAERCRSLQVEVTRLNLDPPAPAQGIPMPLPVALATQMPPLPVDLATQVPVNFATQVPANFATQAPVNLAAQMPPLPVNLSAQVPVDLAPQVPVNFAPQVPSLPGNLATQVPSRPARVPLGYPSQPSRSQRSRFQSNPSVQPRQMALSNSRNGVRGRAQPYGIPIRRSQEMAHNNLNPTGVEPSGSGLGVEPSGSGLGGNFGTNTAPVTNLGAEAVRPIETITGTSADETADDLPLPTSHLDPDVPEFSIDTSSGGVDWLCDLIRR